MELFANACTSWETCPFHYERMKLFGALFRAGGDRCDMCANCGVHTRSSKLGCNLPPLHHTRVFEIIELTLSPTLTEVTNGMADTPKMEDKAKEATLKKRMMDEQSPRRMICYSYSWRSGILFFYGVSRVF
jgi:hypothetical protein